VVLFFFFLTSSRHPDSFSQYACTPPILRGSVVLFFSTQVSMVQLSLYHQTPCSRCDDWSATRRPLRKFDAGCRGGHRRLKPAKQPHKIYCVQRGGEKKRTSADDASTSCFPSSAKEGNSQLLTFAIPRPVLGAVIGWRRVQRRSQALETRKQPLPPLPAVTLSMNTCH
jgi:hypothetical protein